MTRAEHSLDVTIIGGGMITNDLILPSVYHLQRTGVVGTIRVCALSSGPLKALKENEELQRAFPDMDFEAFPPVTQPPDKVEPDLYRKVLAEAPSRQAVIVAVPDDFHYEVVMEALNAGHHVLCVKPLVQRHDQAVEIERLAFDRGLFVGVEYHKRFDRRALVAKRQYAEGRFGEFMMGEAKLHEPYYYRHSNFQRWFTCEKADPFTYVGCHYVDLVSFITGVIPISVSVDGVKRRFPNGNEGYLWSSARLRYENGALLTVTNGLGYPDDAAGSNDQGLIMYCESADRSGMIHHDDHERGVRYSYLEPEGAARYRYISPDFFRLVPWAGAGYQPIGYGFDSIAALIDAMRRVEHAAAGLGDAAALAGRQTMIREIDAGGIVATPANSRINELVVEAGRLSIVNDGARVDIVHGNASHVKMAK